MTQPLDPETVRVLEALAVSPERATELVWTLHARTLGALATRRLPGEGDDVVQQAMIEVIEGLRAGYDGEPPLYEWLRRIARDIGSRRIKRSSRRRTILSTHMGAARERLFAERFESPEATARAREKLAALEALIQQLPELDRQIFERRFTLHQSAAEIAPLVGMSSAAVSTRITRIKATLRRGLSRKEAKDG